MNERTFIHRARRDGGQAAVAGIGSTAFSENLDVSGTDLAFEAIEAAVADAGLGLADIDGVVMYSIDTSTAPDMLAANLGADIGLWAELPHGGTSSCATIATAAMAVESGMADVVLCFRAMTAADFGPTARHNPQWIAARQAGLREFVRPYGWGQLAQTYALQCQRHMHDFGTTEEQLGRAVQAMRAHAATNPNALRSSMTMTEYASSPYVAAPLREDDCFVFPSAGACAVIVTTKERARTLRRPPALIAAALGATARRSVPFWELWPLRDGPITEYASRTLAPRLYERAEIGPTDVDVAEIYDCYSYTMLAQLEDYGFCGKGEGGPFIEDIGIQVGQGLPVNTHGGHLGEAYIHGFNHIVEGVRQIRGTSTAQVADAEVALVTGGAPGPTSALVLTKDR
ncbi:MAG: hypothetical protein BGO11_04390 [Solirubrobacterales bacterium 70-9]|nr:MAG: hypothetical protein BGO11_04390 [Solirubrobacterales bacterium 70-9]